MERGEVPLPVTGRSVVNTEMGIVATNNPLASSVGVQILEQGGNAIDAAIAANSALALMDPTSNGLGGDLFAIVYLAETEEIFGLNASGWSPAALDAQYLKELGHESMPRRGIHSVTVPGVIAGWDAMRRALRRPRLRHHPGAGHLVRRERLSHPRGDRAHVGGVGRHAPAAPQQRPHLPGRRRAGAQGGRSVQEPRLRQHPAAHRR